MLILALKFLGLPLFIRTVLEYPCTINGKKSTLIDYLDLIPGGLGTGAKPFVAVLVAGAMYYGYSMVTGTPPTTEELQKVFVDTGLTGVGATWLDNIIKSVQAAKKAYKDGKK